MDIGWCRALRVPFLRRLAGIDYAWARDVEHSQTGAAW